MPEITITETAQKKITKLLGEHENKFLRISIQGVGWGGPKFGLTLDELNETDQHVEVSGIKLLFNKGDAPYLDHCKIDYFEDAFRGGFSISASPQHASNCCWLQMENAYLSFSIYPKYPVCDLFGYHGCPAHLPDTEIDAGQGCFVAWSLVR